MTTFLLIVAVALLLVWFLYIIRLGYRYFSQPNPIMEFAKLLPFEYRPRFVDGEWKSGFTIEEVYYANAINTRRNQLTDDEKRDALANVIHADSINIFGEYYRWNPDKKELESVNEIT